MKKALCLFLAALMTVSLAACGKKEGNSNQNAASGTTAENATLDASHFFESKYHENLPEEIENSSNQKFFGQSMFFVGNNENYTKPGLYSYSVADDSLKTYVEFDNSAVLDPTEEIGDINYYDVSNNTIIYIYHSYYTDPALNDVVFSVITEADIYKYYSDFWGYDEEMTKAELESDYYAQFKNEDGTFDYGGIYKKMIASDYPTYHKYFLVGMDMDGNEIFNYELKDFESSTDTVETAYISDVAIDKDDNCYILYNKYGEDYDDYCIRVFDKNGTESAEYKQTEYIDKFYKLSDGSVTVSSYDDSLGTVLKKIDTKTAEIDSNPVFSSNHFGYGAISFDNDHMLSIDSIGLKLLSNGKTDPELYMKWMDSNILSGNVYTFGLLDDGKIALYLSHYNGNEFVSEIVELTETDKEKLLNKTQLRIATLYLSADLEEAVVEFNKKSNDYHVDVVTFDYTGEDYENYNTYMDNFMLSLATDNSIDMIALNDATAYNHVINFAQKGLLIDLSPLIEGDSNVNESEFIQNLIDPFRYDGKLIAIPAGVSITTLIGKKSDVGDKMGWDPQKAQKILASKGEDALFMLYTTKEEMLEREMNLSYNEFVDVEKGRCDFDNDTFVQALEFSNIFPEVINWDDESYAANEPERVNKGKILVGSETVSNFEVIQQYQKIWNDDVTYIGYPSAGDNNGALIWYDGMYGITKNCESPEVAWSLISNLIKAPKDKAEYDEMYGAYNLYVRPTKDNLDIYLDLVSDLYSQEDYITYWDSYEIEMKPLTDKMRQDYKDVVYGTTAVFGSVPKGVMDIIKEEASSYYSGQKSAKEVAAIVQSRVKIYLSETR